MADLERCLREAAGRALPPDRTDGVFSMDGDLAPLDAICDLAEKYDAMVMVDDSHATGFLGEAGRGTPEHCGVEGRVDIITSTLGKALGGASGGFTAGRAEIIDLLRQRSRPYLFSNTLAPAVAGAAIDGRSICIDGSDRAARQARWRTPRCFRAGDDGGRLRHLAGKHPIVPVMLGDAPLALRMAEALLDEGIYVIGFSYPVVPQGPARIRVQLSAAHERADLERAVAAFRKVGSALGVV